MFHSVSKQRLVDRLTIIVSGHKEALFFSDQNCHVGIAGTIDSCALVIPAELPCVNQGEDCSFTYYFREKRKMKIDAGFYQRRNLSGVIYNRKVNNFHSKMSSRRSEKRFFFTADSIHI